jgi:hypothetical protein
LKHKPSRMFRTEGNQASDHSGVAIGGSETTAVMCEHRSNSVRDMMWDKSGNPPVKFFQRLLNRHRHLNTTSIKKFSNELSYFTRCITPLSPLIVSW